MERQGWRRVARRRLALAAGLLGLTLAGCVGPFANLGPSAADCDYVARLEAANRVVLAGVVRFGSSANVRTLDELDGEIVGFIEEFEGFQLSRDVEPIRSGVIDLYTEMREPLGRLRRVALEGDTEAVQQGANAVADGFVNRLDALQRANAGGAAKLTDCARRPPR
jgi:hypothetical protein